MTTLKSRMYDNFTMIKALDEVDQVKAIQAVSDPNLNPEELSELIECSLLGKIVNKNSQEPLKLSNSVVAAAILNRLKQIEISSHEEF